MCSLLPAPPLATTGTPTASLARRVMTRSNPAWCRRRQWSLTRSRPRRAPRRAWPIHGVEAGVLAAAMREHAHLSGAIFLASIETTMHWLPNFSAPCRMSSGLAMALELMESCRPGAEHREHVVHGFDAAAHGERHEALVGGSFDDVHHRAAPVRGGGDVEEHHFIRALLVVAEREFHGVANVAQAAFFSDAELDAAGDVAVVNVETRDNTFCNHVDN